MNKIIIKYWFMIPLILLVCWLSRNNYWVFHFFVELFSVIIASTIFVIGWNTREFISNNKLILISIAYLLVAIFDVIHIITYQGTNLISWTTTNISTQYWIAARYIEAISFLIYVNLLKKSILSGLISCYLFIFLLVL